MVPWVQTLLINYHLTLGKRDQIKVKDPQNRLYRHVVTEQTQVNEPFYLQERPTVNDEDVLHWKHFFLFTH